VVELMGGTVPKRHRHRPRRRTDLLHDPAVNLVELFQVAMFSEFGLPLRPVSGVRGLVIGWAGPGHSPTSSASMPAERWPGTTQ
jgi:hypothetical protein